MFDMVMVIMMTQRRLKMICPK